VLVAILSLAGGIGSTTVMLTVRNVVFYNPPPLYYQPEMLWRVTVVTPESRRGAAVPGGLFRLWLADAELRTTMVAAGRQRAVELRNALVVLEIFGVLAFAVTRRSKELALRVAIGASRSDVTRFVALRSLQLVIVGGVVGVGATFALTRVVRAAGGAGSAFDTPAWPAFAIPVVIVMLVCGLATWIPTRRALRIDPAVLLRLD
jgi:FtsX-like permease family